MTVKKINWNENLLKQSNEIVDKELNRGLILSIGNVTDIKKIKVPKGYNSYLENNGLKGQPQNIILKNLLKNNQFDFYLYNILSTDSFYSKGKNAKFTNKINIEFVLCIYIANDKKYLKGYYSLFDANKNQINFTQTCILQELNEKSFIMVDDILYHDLKGIKKEAFEKCVDNFQELKTISGSERRTILQDKCKLLKEITEKDTMYISLQTQEIIKLKNEFNELKQNQ